MVEKSKTAATAEKQETLAKRPGLTVQVAHNYFMMNIVIQLSWRLMFYHLRDSGLPSCRVS